MTTVELDYQLLLAYFLGNQNDDVSTKLFEDVIEVRRMLYALLIVER